MNKKEGWIHSLLIGLTLGAGVYGITDSQNLDVLIILIISVLLGVTAWIVTKIASERIAQGFFYLQRFSWFHFLIRPELLDEKNFFLASTPKSSTSSLFLLWIGSWAFVVFIAYNMVFTLGISLPSDEIKISSNFDVLILAWIMTPIVSLIVVPISIIESSNLRLFLKIKKKIISPTTPSRYIIGGFVTMNVLQTLLRGLDTSELIASIIYLPAPFYIMTFLYKIRTENSLVEKFVLFLKEKNIVQKDVKLD